MKKSRELQILDFACIKTIEENKNSTIDSISAAIHTFLTMAYAGGFPQNVKESLIGIQNEKVEKELILNLVKQKACEKYYGFQTKVFDDHLPIQNDCDLIYNKLRDEGMKALKDTLDEYPKLYYTLCLSFTVTRYFNNNYTGDKLDDEIILTDVEKSIFERINNYYKLY